MGKRFLIGRRSVVLSLAALALTAVPAGAEECPTGRVTITGAFGKAAFNVDVADTDATRAQGLMHVEAMPLSRGMLFVYETPQPLAFWMRNTLIPLDMLFVDASGVIRHIHHRARPLDETVISGGPDPLRGVLEINGGLAARLGIAPGDVLRHPAFASPDAPWSCGTGD